MPVRGSNLAAALEKAKELLSQGGTYSKLCSLQFEHTSQIISEDRPVRDIADFSREFRTNLNSITGMLALLDEDISEVEHIEIKERMFKSIHGLIEGVEQLEKNQTPIT